jgi:hypothetical protein
VLTTNEACELELLSVGPDAMETYPNPELRRETQETSWILWQLKQQAVSSTFL